MDEQPEPTETAAEAWEREELLREEERARTAYRQALADPRLRHTDDARLKHGAALRRPRGRRP